MVRKMHPEAVHHGVKKLFIDPGLGFYYRNLKDSKERISYQMETFLHTFPPSTGLAHLPCPSPCL